MAKGKALFQKLKNIHLNKIQKLILLFILAGIVIGLPYVVSNQYTLHIVILCCMYCCLTLSLNLIIGWSGQFSLGHVCFYGMGAYITTLLMMNVNMNFFLATLISVVATTLFSMLLCWPTLKLRGDYLAVITLGFGEVFRLVLTNAVVFREYRIRYCSGLRSREKICISTLRQLCWQSLLSL